MRYFSRKFLKWNLSEQNVGKNSEKISNYGLMRVGSDKNPSLSWASTRRYLKVEYKGVLSIFPILLV